MSVESLEEAWNRTIDEVWSGIFGSADNGITIPEEDDSNNNGGFFDMTDDEGNNDPVLGG